MENTVKNNTLQISSLNINGLRYKKNKVIDFIKQNNIHILLLQEIHNIDIQQTTLYFRQNGLVIYCNKIRNEHNNFDGTAFIFKKDLESKFCFQNYVLQNNRLQKLSVTSKENDYNFDIYNLYLKTGDTAYVKRQRLKSLELLEQNLKESGDKDLRTLVGGDFNFVTHEMDTNKIPNGGMDIEKWVQIENIFNLKDSFRRQHPSKRAYTKITCSTTTRRIDRLHCNFKVNNYDHIPISFSDHILSPTLTINGSTQIKWGEGSWKLNVNLIDVHTVETIKGMWSSFKMFNDQTDIKVFWDKMKNMLKKYYIIKGKQKSKNNKNDLQKKEQEINNLIENLTAEQLQDSTRYRDLKVQIMEYEKMKVRCFQIHNRVKNIQNEMEYPSKSFYSKLTKEKEKSQISVIKNNKGKLETEPEKIIDVIYKFYKDLWQNENMIDEQVQNNYLENIGVIEQDKNYEQNQYTSPFFDMEDLEEALQQQFKKGNSPGSDGFSYEFYKGNWETIKDDLLQTYNSSYISQNLPKSMNETIVKLIPKKGDLSDVKNWRPISMLNVDYKLLSRMIYNKTVKILNKRTSLNQKAIFPGRQLVDVHLNTASVIQYSKEHRNTNLAIAKFDLEKAFDNVNHRFMFKMLAKLKLPTPLIKWIQILYKKPTCKILVNGAFSQIINIRKGLRQGCPLSMLLFGIVLEALIQKIEKNEMIQGVSLGPSTTLKLQACVDDLDYYVTTNASLVHILHEMEKFWECAGQKINKDKTEIITQGPMMNEGIRNSIFCNKVVKKINILGIVYSFEEDNLDENIIKVIKKMKSVIEIHKERNLSYYGRIQIIKSLIMPLIFQKMLCLDIKTKHLKEVQDIISKFLWFPDNELIERRVIIADYEYGGLNMVDVQSRYQAAVLFKTKQIAQAINKNEFWIKYAYFNIGSTLRLVNQELYSNREPHKSSPAGYWRNVQSLLLKVFEKNKEINWKEIEFKELYKLLKKENAYGCKSKPWMDIHLFKKDKHLFTNKERQYSFLIAHNAVMCGQKRRFSEIFVDIPRWNLNNCKFCHFHTDNIDHWFSGECAVIKKVFDVSKGLYYMTTSQRLLIDRKLIYYNTVENWETEYLKVKLIAIIKKTIMIEKAKLDKYGSFVQNKDNFVYNNIMYEVRRHFMFTLKNNAILINSGTNNYWCILNS